MEKNVIIEIQNIIWITNEIEEFFLRKHNISKIIKTATLKKLQFLYFNRTPKLRNKLWIICL